MRDYSKLFKRVQAWVLTVAMILPVLSGALILPASAADEALKSLTDGEIVADNYDLTDAEKALLSSGLLVGETYEVSVPEDGDNLVSVDEETKVITAKPYEKGGYVWKPVSADIVVDTAVKQTIALVDGVGTHTYSGNAYSVKVLYQLDIEIAADIQEKLLNALSLKTGVKNFDEIWSNNGTLELLASDDVMSVLLQIGSGVGYPFESPFGMGSLKFTTDEARASAAALKAELDANSGAFVLADYASAYDSSAYKTKFVVENGEAVRDELKALYAHIYNVHSDLDATFTGFLEDYMPAAVKLFMGKLESWLTAMDAVLNNSWDASNADFLKPGMTDFEWAKLDTLVDAIDTATDVSGIEIKNPLVAAQTTVQFNLKMYNVTVEVNMNVAGSKMDTPVCVDQKSTVLTLTANASTDDILNAVKASGIEAKAVAEWTAKGFYVPGHFASEATPLAGELTEDITYVITISPKYYNVSYGYSAIVDSAPYGYRLVLPECQTAGQVYDYEVNGATYYEKDVVVITGDTYVTRSQNKAYDILKSLNGLVSDVYFGAADKAADILTSGALTVGNQTIAIRTPGDDCLTINAGTLYAEEYASGYKGINWIPTSYKLVGGVNNGATGAIVDGKADLTQVNYEQVIVSYTLALSEDVTGLVKLPGLLNDEAEDQLSALNSIAKYTDDLGSLSRFVLENLADLIKVSTLSDDPAKDAAIKEDFVSVINGILADCMDGNSLKLHGMLTEYKSQGLLYYYQNSKSVQDALSDLSFYLDALLETDEKQAALTKLMNENGFGSYSSKLPTLQSAMASVTADLKSPNAAIDLTSKNLNALVQALTSVGSVQPDNAGKAFTLTEDLMITAPDKGQVVVTLVGGGKSITVSSAAFPLDYILTVDDVAKIKAAVAQTIQDMKLSDAFYNTTYTADALDQFVGHKITGTAKVSYEWTAKQFTVIVPGMDEQIISINDLTIALQASPEYGIIYKYTIGDKTDLVNAYTFTQEEVINLFKNGSYTVARTEINVKEQNLVDFVNKLNASVDNGAVEFVLVKTAEKYVVVMKMDGSRPNALAGSMQGMAMGFVQSGYSYIGMGGNGVLAGGKISLQAIIDTIMYSGFTSDQLIAAVKSNGSVNHMTLKGDALVGDMSQLGGKLIASTMNVGDDAVSSQELDFYITLGSAGNEILQIRNLFAEQLGGYLKMVCANGKTTLQLTVPEKAYEAYLAVLLATGNLDIRNLNAVDAAIAMGYVKNFVDPLFTGDVSLETATNTLKEFGYNVDLSKYEGAFDKICEQYSRTEIVYDEKSGTITRTISIKPVLDALNVPSALASVIKEYETGITVSGVATLENLDKHYEALYVDVRADGATNKIGLTSNLAAKLPTLAGASVIVLLDDVAGDLAFSKTTVLNLNGFTVKGSITSSGNLTIVDSAMTADCGAVEGTVSGNVSILGGEYATDVSKFLKEGYAQVDGKVGNEFYAFVKDEDGNITIEIDAGLVKTNALPDVKFLLLDFAMELLFNGYTTNKLLINGNKVFDISLDDFVGIYTGDDRLNTLVHSIVGMVDAADLAAIVTELMSDMNDYAALQAAVLNNQPLVAYEMTIGSWKLELQHITDGDYLSIGVGSGNEKTKNLYVKIVGSEADKQHVADVLGALKDTTDVTIKFEANHGFDKSDDKNLVLDLNAFATIDVNFSNNYDYAVMFSILLADGLAGSATSEKLVNGIRTYYETGDISALRAAFDAVTTSQAITAAKNFARNDSITVMVQNLGIADVVADSVINLEKLLDRYGKGAAMVLRQIDRLQGGDRTLGSFYKESLGGSGFVKTDLDKTFARKLFKGYGVTLNMAVSEVRICINLFGDMEISEDAPVIENVVVDVTHEDIAGVKIDGEFIYLDAHSNGLHADDLLGAMGFVVTNGQIVNVEINTVGRVVTGSVITITAQNPVTGDTATMVLTVIVLGDVDCDGRATVKDATIMADYFVYGLELNEYQILALDADWSGSFNVKDALVLSDKFVYWEDYNSGLNA